MSTFQIEVTSTGNRLLDLLGPDAIAEVIGQLEEVRLDTRRPLLDGGASFESVLFPTTAAAVLLARARGAAGVQVVTVGNEGLLGLPMRFGSTALDTAQSIQVQVPGVALRMSSETFREALQGNGAFLEIVDRYTELLYLQLVQQVVCNGLHSIEERSARWLLSAHDRYGTDEFPVTQEYLAQMLGVRRPSVTVVAANLQRAGYIGYRRGHVTVVDRAGLESAACDCYRAVREHTDRLLS